MHRVTIFLIALLVTCMPAAADDAPARSVATNDYAALVKLFQEFREFAPPPMHDGVPDYTPAAMATQAERLKGFMQRLVAIDDSQWPVSQRVDYMIVLA